MRRLLSLTSTAALVLTLTTTTASAAPVKAAPKADLVMRHGSVELPSGKQAQAVAVRNGKIVFVGSDRDVRRFVGTRTKVVDLKGRTLMPGISDGHIHLAPNLPVCDLNYGAYTVSELQAKLATCVAEEEAAGKQDDDWMRVVNWDMTSMKPAGLVPTKAILDVLNTQRPIFVFSADGHNALVNSRGLQVAGINAATPNPQGGEIVRDGAGNPTGYLKEDTAIALVAAKIPPAPLAERVAGLRDTLAYASSKGLTSYQPQLLDETDLQAWKYLADRHELPALVRGSLSLDANEAAANLPATLKRIKHLRATYEGPNFRITSVGEIFVDGVIEYPNQTAQLLRPYRIKNAAGKWVPGPSRGPVRVKQKRLNRVIAALDKAGWQAHLHTIGDGAARQALDAVAHARKVNGRHGPRHIVAHAQLVAPADYRRFMKLNVTAAVATQWAEKDPYTMDTLKPYIGKERWNRLYPWGSLTKAGARLANGSDFPVEDLNPMLQLQMAVTRTIPNTGGVKKYAGPLGADQRLTLDQAIRIHTLNTAYLLGLEKKTGSLQVGKRFDAIVLSGNLRKVPVRKIGALTVLRTYSAGNRVS